MIYFISDTHFYHKNIIKYCNRPFADVEQMNNELIKNWNEVVSPNDTIYHLGDFSMGNKDISSLDIIYKLNGRKILILGNHDKWKKSIYESFGFTVLKAPIRLDEYKLVLSHYPIPDKQIPKDYINLHGHIHDKSLYNEYDKFDPNEYSLEKHINLSCDVINFRPISLDQVLSKN